ncbi:uncharacterized protein LY89DRAFT_786614 [Mollisia scopiformis]|uniref:Uncharacterized protein n=1 Tax=Mollisia scopiformis TaxID=149040 RepID=A0A194WVP5_MOLSC|nr:uncharacterized protein LY89DRAFT_786614 [Mollisia scopiformis]KUJ11744.1 hypothetical protein LY89DRAFT_786614 [Mollisia scopiformis]
MNRLMTPVSESQDPQFFSSSQDLLEMRVEDLISRDRIDVCYNRETTARRRRIEWPSENEDFFKTFEKISITPSPIGDAQREEALKLLHDEVSKCNEENGIDVHIWERYPAKNDKHIRQLLMSLYYRARIQSTLLDIFVVLVQRSFITLDNLRTPIELNTTSEACCEVNRLLSTFRAIERERNLDLGPTDKLPYAIWDFEFVYEAVDWLSAMIVRGCTDIQSLFGTIEISGYLGKVDEKAWERMKKAVGKISFVCNKSERAATSLGLSNFGFWLPHGLGDVSEESILQSVADCFCRFDRIERVFKRFFNIPDDELVTAEKQAQYLDKHRERCSPALRKYLENEFLYRKASGRQG